MEDVKNLNPEEKRNEQYSNPMGYAPVLPLIIKMSIPSMFAMLISALYNIVDSIYVAKYSEAALTAVSVVYPVQMLIVAVSVGTGVGIMSLISRRLGEKRLEAAQSAVDHGIILGNLEWLFFLLFGIIGSKLFCRAFSNSMEITEMATTYCTIVCIGSVFIFNAIAGERIMQSCGNMLFPMFAQIAGSVTNIILDPIMIFGKYGCPAMGVAGAAYATIIGQFVSMTVAYIFLYKGNFPIRINFRGFRWNKTTVKDIYNVALPAMVMQAITSLTISCLNLILKKFSDTAVAVLGAYFKLQSFVFMPVFGLNQGVMPIMGYNYGARNKKRLFTTLKDALILAASIMIIGTAVCHLIPDKLMMMFEPSEEMMALGIKALRTISICFPFAALSIIPGSLFQATAHGMISMFCSVLRQIVIIIPAAYLLSQAIGVNGVWWSYPCAEGMALIYTWIMFARLYKKELKNL